MYTLELKNQFGGFSIDTLVYKKNNPVPVTFKKNVDVIRNIYIIKEIDSSNTIVTIQNIDTLFEETCDKNELILVNVDSVKSGDIEIELKNLKERNEIIETNKECDNKIVKSIGCSYGRMNSKHFFKRGL